MKKIHKQIIEEWNVNNDLLKECYQLIGEVEKEHQINDYKYAFSPRKKTVKKKIEIPKRRYV